MATVCTWKPRSLFASGKEQLHAFVMLRWKSESAQPEGRCNARWKSFLEHHFCELWTRVDKGRVTRRQVIQFLHVASHLVISETIKTQHFYPALSARSRNASRDPCDPLHRAFSTDCSSPKTHFTTFGVNVAKVDLSSILQEEF